MATKEDLKNLEAKMATKTDVERLEKRIRYLMKEDERIGNQRTEDMEKAIRNEE